MPKNAKRTAEARLERRKTPVQARARRMAEDLLAGATRVLAEVGAEGFTTNHVAAATGASIGSLYQYYPNKAALLAALHERDATQLWRGLEEILQDRTRSPRERLGAVIERVFLAQQEAAELHAALQAESVDVPETPGFAELEAAVCERLAGLLGEGTSLSASERRDRAAHVWLVLAALLGRLARDPLEPAALERLGRDTAAMLIAFTGL